MTDARTYAVPGRARTPHHRASTSGRKRWAAGGVATMIAVGTLGVFAPPASADVRAGRTVEIFHGRNIVGLEGYPPSTSVTVDVLRGDAVIGTATYTTDATGFLEINHLGDGDCWQSKYTPNILPGDVVRTTVSGEPSEDTTATRDVFINQDAEFVAPDIIRVSGHAKDTAAAPFQPGDIVELRMNKVSRTNGWETNDGRRDLRLADVLPFRQADGTYSHDFKVSVDDWNDAQTAGIDISTVWIRGTTELTFYDGEPEATVGCPPLMPDDLTPPSQVTGVIASQPALGTVELDWSAATDNVSVTGYVITRTNLDTGAEATATVAGSEVFWSQTRVPTGRYSYTVHAVDGTGNTGDRSAAVLVGVGVEAPPAAPTGVTATATGSSIDLSWTAPATGTQAVSYQVLRGTTVVADVVNGTTYTDANRPVGTHTYTVKSRAADGALSPASEPASAEVLTPPDTTAPVVGTLSGTRSGSAATLTWPAATDAVGVTGYRVFRNGVQVGADLSADARTYTDSGLTEGAYSYTLRAFDAAGNVSNASNAVSLTIDTTAPGVSAQSPAADATGVPVADDLSVTFSEGVSGVSNTTFTVAPAAGGAAVPATVARVGTTNQWTLNPSANLAGSTQYRVTLTGGATAIRDAANNPLATTSWTFTTTAVDTTAPTVSSRTPALNATGVPVGSNVTATFSEAVQGVSGTTVTLRPTSGTTTVGATVTYNATTRVATLDPTANLAAGTQYTATLTGGTSAIRDMANNPLATTSWTFTTAAAVTDTTAPTVTGRSPASGATGASRTANITFTFSEAVQGVSTTTVTLRNVATNATWGGTVTRNGTTNQWILDPTNVLLANTQYSVTLTGGTTAIRDLANNPLVTTSWRFTTGA